MTDLFVVFWTVMIFASIAWYGFLLFYVGFKGGREIRALTKTLGERKAPEKNPEERFARREMRQHLADAIKQLAPELRQVCLLRDVLQYSTQETAERVGISAMAVRLRLFRAHRRLRERLSVALQPKKERQAHASVAQIRAPEAGRKREPRIPLGAFAECACGD